MVTNEGGTDQLTHAAHASGPRPALAVLSAIPGTRIPAVLSGIVALWMLIPTPAHARRMRLDSVEKVLKERRIRRLNAEQVLQCLRTQPVTVAAVGLEATTTRIRLLLQQQLVLTEKQIHEAQHAMETILASDQTPVPSASQEPVESKPSASEKPLCDVEILSSMPGVGTTVLATLLSKASSLVNNRDYKGLRCLCGVAPVTRRSGKSWRVVRRRASRARLVNALYHWSRVAIQHDPISKAKYKTLRERGHSHGRALPPIGRRPPARHRLHNAS